MGSYRTIDKAPMDRYLPQYRAHVLTVSFPRKRRNTHVTAPWLRVVKSHVWNSRLLAALPAAAFRVDLRHTRATLRLCGIA